MMPPSRVPLPNKGWLSVFPSVSPQRIRKWFQDTLFRRLFKNAGVLLGGASVSGVLGLVYLALTARALGPELFGILMLIHTYVKVVGGLIRFQSWQAVVRYGARCLERHRTQDFQRLITFTFLLDAGSAVVGIILAAGAASLIGPWVGLSPEAIPMTMLYSSILVFFNMGSPNGILRLLDRFDLLSIQSVIQALVRLIGAGVGFTMGVGLPGFLFVWWLSGIISGLAVLAMGWMEMNHRNLLEEFRYSIRGLVKTHQGLWPFVWSTNILSSLNVASGQIGMLVIGAVMGPASAGLFKIASQFGRSLAKPAGFLARSVYPEVAKLWEQGNPKVIKRLCWRAGFLAGGFTSVTLLALILLGKPLLQITAGDAFVGAYGVMLLLVLAMTIQGFVFAANPALIALGRPDILLRIRFGALMVYFPLLWILLHTIGLNGAGIATVANSLITSGLMVIIALRELSQAATAKPIEKAKHGKSL